MFGRWNNIHYYYWILDRKMLGRVVCEVMGDT